MKRIVVILALTLIVGIALGVIADRVLRAQPAPLKVSDLLKADVVGMGGKEVLVQLGEFAPGAASGKHSHAGHEVAYILAGSAIREIEGQPPLAMKAGDSAYIPAKKVHETKNARKSEPLKLLVFRIHEKGQPVTQRVTEPYFQK